MIVAVAVFGGAVKLGVGAEVLDVEVAELLVCVVDCIVARAVHAALACRPIFIDYHTQTRFLLQHTPRLIIMT